jgi:Na+/proline symporter/signal transduction histidine kinase
LPWVPGCKAAGAAVTFDLPVLFGAAVGYLALLFLIAYAAERGWIPERWTNRHLVYVLSLGVYASSWSYYGSVGFAQSHGFQFLTIYLGVTVAFLMSPLLLRPLLKLTRDYQLTSLADLLAFRFRSQTAGALVTLFMLIGSLPYLALQIRAVTESLQVLTREAAPQMLALGFCAILILFAILFGARHISPRGKHRGLVVAIAFESLVKLVALVIVGLFAVFGVFSGPGALNQWLAEHPEAIAALYEPVHQGPWATLLFLAFAAAFLLPRQFHMAFAENADPTALGTASWGFPLFLLLLNLAIPPILWAGSKLALDMNPDYYVLGITLHQSPSWLPVLAFLGGVSAASAMVIVSTLALSAMSLNHLLLPASYPYPRVDLYRWLLWGRRALITVIILASYGFYELLEHNQGLVQLGLISFVAVAQFLPGILGVLYWPRANRVGFIAGLLGGISVWVITLLLPLLASSGFITMDLDLDTLAGQSGLDHWELATFWSLTINAGLFVTLSLVSRQSDAEQEAARACRTEAFTPLTGVVSARSTREFTDALADIIGARTAEREVRQALLDVDMAESETRPSELRRLRERIERNLSGLLGPQLSHMIVNQRLVLDAHSRTALAESMRYIEQRLEDSHSRLQGLSAALDNLRRYHRQILLDLPLGVCTIDPEQTVLTWNLAMEVMTGLNAQTALGRRLSALPAPWGETLRGFALSQDQHAHHMKLRLGARPHWFNLHKAATLDPSLPPEQSISRTGTVILVEDLTNLENLEAELAHSDRLASVGRLAAGVAHEIGNPVTGIASLAQNLREETRDPTVRDAVDEILGQTRRISGIVQSLMGFSHSGMVSRERQEFNLLPAIEEAMRLVRLTREAKHVDCSLSCSDQLKVFGDPQRISQALVNLFTNACDASKPGDRVEIIALAEAGGVRIEVLDQGEGIPEELKDEVLLPFFTTKQPGEGTGLGLPMADRIIREHQGSLEIDSQPGVGTRVVIRLPDRRGRLDHDQDTDH